MPFNMHQGDDEFNIRAFALRDGSDAGESEEQKNKRKVKVQAGAGTDFIKYTINAPVDIDGGVGFDTVSAITTELDDVMIVTSYGIYGAGLFITFTNIGASPGGTCI